MKLGKKSKQELRQSQLAKQQAVLDRPPATYGSRTQASASASAPAPASPPAHGADHEDTLTPDEASEVLNEQDKQDEQTEEPITDVSLDAATSTQDPLTVVTQSPSPIDEALYESVNVEAERVAREAVTRVLNAQADARLFDTLDQQSASATSMRFVVELDAADIAVLRGQWDAFNASLLAAGSPKIAFSAFISRRLRTCLTHDSVRPIYIDDRNRRRLEDDLLQTSILNANQLTLEVERRVKPIVEFTNGEAMRIGPLDLRILERVPGWFPDKPADKAISDFMIDAAMGVAGY
jgi:hypothetical protein